MYATLIQSIVDNMNLSNREELLAAMNQSMQPNPQAQQMQQQAQQLQMQFQQSQTAALSAQAQESSARAQKLAAEAAVVPQELEIDKINAVTRNLREGDQDDKEFERRMKVADTLIKEKQIEGKRNVNGPRTESPAPASQPGVPRNIPTNNGAGSQGGGVV
jgi:phosphopantothenoylcysteine synthetase/decarboxylase